MCAAGGFGGARAAVGLGDALPRVLPPLCGLGLCARAVFVTGTRCYRAELLRLRGAERWLKLFPGLCSFCEWRKNL